MGNTLEAICGETVWGGAYTTQRLIDSVKAAGFNTVRLPCAWDCHATNGVINPAWLARVQEIVDYCINDDLYVILNIHWDGGWLENNVTTQAPFWIREFWMRSCKAQKWGLPKYPRLVQIRQSRMDFGLSRITQIRLIRPLLSIIDCRQEFLLH